MENVKLNAVKLLSKKLSKDGLKCVPEGVHHIEEIYSLVKAEYPDLCDDTLLCKDVCSCGANQPEWKHRVRNIMTRLKNKGAPPKDYSQEVTGESVGEKQINTWMRLRSWTLHVEAE